MKPAADPYYLMVANGFAAAVVALAAEVVVVAAEVVVVASEVIVVAVVGSTLHISHQPRPHEPGQEVGHSDCTLHVHLKPPQ